MNVIFNKYWNQLVDEPNVYIESNNEYMHTDQPTIMLAVGLELWCRMINNK